MDLMIEECNTFLREVEDWVYDVLSWNNEFRFQLQVPRFKTELSKRFSAYTREISKVELAISKFDNVPEEIMQKSLLVNAVLLKKSLEEALEKVINIAEKLRLVAQKARVSFEEELMAVKVNIGQNWERQFLKLDNKLTTLCRIKKIKKQGEEFFNWV